MVLDGATVCFRDQATPSTLGMTMCAVCCTSTYHFERELVRCVLFLAQVLCAGGGDARGPRAEPGGLRGGPRAQQHREVPLPLARGQCISHVVLEYTADVSVAQSTVDSHLCQQGNIVQ